ncbi:hypothetical protein F0223_23500, partial [Vibrio coralliilyticus]|uniref:hypothetical protein n=2 Tax=Vibrio TaxID=662 RepID=UPI00148E866C
PMAQQNSPQTRSNVNSATSVSPLGHESSPKNDSSKGFTVAVGSEISPKQLAAYGFQMNNFQFFPSSIQKVESLLNTRMACSRIKAARFRVEDKSYFGQRIYYITSV